MDLQEAIERFLSDTERRRSDVTVRRFREAMELLQSFLAVRLLDPDSPDPSPRDQLEDLTPAVVEAFLNEFLAERLRGNDRARRRYGAATRAFVQWLARGQLLPEAAAVEILGVLRQERAEEHDGADGADEAERLSGEIPGGLMMVPRAAPEGAEEEHFFQVVDVRRDRLALLDVETALEVMGDRPEAGAVEPGDLVAGVLGRRRGRLWVSAVRLVADDEGLDEDGALDDWDEDLFDDDDDAWGDSAPMVEDALEILASEDRYAPREVVRVILSNIDEARDDLMDWLTDDDYRNEPLPGAGEAPANAARLLSEVRESEALPRLLAVLGDTDPLGEEAPAALGRFGADVLEALAPIYQDRDASDERRTAALWGLCHLAARNPALRRRVAEALLGELPEVPAQVAGEVIGALEELRAVEVLDEVLALAAAGRVDFEAYERTAELFASRVTGEGYGERLAESLLPVLFLYPSNEELEEFYESLEEDLGDLWDLMSLEADEDGLGDDDGEGGDSEPDNPSAGGKVIPFRRPPD